MTGSTTCQWPLLVINIPFLGFAVKLGLISIEVHDTTLDSVVVPNALIVLPVIVSVTDRVRAPFTFVVLLSVLSGVVLCKVSHL